MLQFSTPLSPTATELVIYCLEISADLAQPDALGDEWGIAYPLSAKCFTRERARETLLDLLAKLRLPQTYIPTTYHWLILYECLHLQIACLNDDPWPDFVDRMKASRDDRDKACVGLPLDSQGNEGVQIHFEAFLDVYFPDTDFLLDPSTYYALGEASRQQLGYRGDLFSVVSGLVPHPSELALKTVEEMEETEPDGEEGNGEPSGGVEPDLCS